MSKDYYKILGVAEFDSAENIKSAYRKLARKWHPDIAGNTPDVLSRFKEINEAYDILSNDIKKEAGAYQLSCFFLISLKQPFCYIIRTF